MSSSTPAAAPAASGTPAAPAAAPKIPAATPAKKWYAVRKGHDHGKFEGQTEADAEQAFNKHFGITGTQHRPEIQVCDAPKEGEHWHSGQKVTR